MLVWQWGRRGAGPRFAVDLTRGLSSVPGVVGLLSLSAQSELMRGRAPPRCALAYPTYVGLAGYLARLLSVPWSLPALVRSLRALAPDVAICAMPGPLDLLMSGALRRLGVPYFVVIHDADAHPGDGFVLQMTLQRRLARHAAGLITLSGHVADLLDQQGGIGSRRLIRLYHPPFAFGEPPPPPRAHGGPLRLLFFGRLLPYKGLDLFAAALRALGPRADIVVRVAGQGPETDALRDLRALPGVVVKNGWVAEDQVAALLAWADAVVLSHVEASQSGVASAAVAARRWLVATRVGGLVEQLQSEPLARLCEPTPASLASAIRSLVEDPPTWSAQDEGGRSWHDMATSLVAEIRRA